MACFVQTLTKGVVSGRAAKKKEKIQRTKRDCQPRSTVEANVTVRCRDVIVPALIPVAVKTPTAPERADAVCLLRRGAGNESSEGAVAKGDGVDEGRCEGFADVVLRVRRRGSVEEEKRRRKRQTEIPKVADERCHACHEPQESKYACTLYEREQTW
jgi:hypothetical protein